MAMAFTFQVRSSMLHCINMGPIKDDPPFEWTYKTETIKVISMPDFF